MNMIRFGLLSDIHLSGKKFRLVRALEKLRDVDILLIAGDIANGGAEEQFALAREAFLGYPESIPVFIVSGNHDIPGNDESRFRAFERDMLQRSESRFDVELSECGAFYVRLSENLDLMGLNPLYYQKLFHFPNRGEQLAFMEERLAGGDCANHIVLCHPPLAAHNPQRGRPYFPKEQNNRLQRIVDEYPRVLFISGHTHLYPEIEPEDEYGNIYINDGSVCPTQSKSSQSETFPGNVITFEAGETFTRFRTVFLGSKSKKECHLC